MTAKNDVTGSEIKSRPANAAYRDGYDRIFNQKTAQQRPVNAADTSNAFTAVASLLADVLLQGISND